MTVQNEYTTKALQVQDAWADAATTWTQNLQKVTEQVPTPVVSATPVDPTVYVERWFDFVSAINEANRQYVKNLAGVPVAAAGAVRQHVEDISEAVRGQVQALSSTVADQVEQVEQAEREKAEQAEQAEQAEREQAEKAEREQARQARAAEREQTRQERQAARERYEGLTKAELVEKLGQRDLPKTGNVDELVERLVDADTSK